MGAGPGDMMRKKENVEYASTNRISYVPAQK